MKLIIPVAGMGTRLRPHTHTTPKVLIKVAGKTIIEHILDKIFQYQNNIDEIIFIVGYMKEQIQEYLDKKYQDKVKLSYVHQEEMLGVGHAIYLTEKYVNNDSVFIILGDTIFKADFNNIIQSNKNYIGVKEVEDPRRFGIAFLNEDKTVKKFVEKPENPETNLAMVGIYLIQNSELLFKKLNYLIENNIRTKNEFQLTDALQLMLEEKEKFEVFTIDKWLDCGKKETLLSTNRILLEENMFHQDYNDNVIIREPVYIGEGTKISNSIIGPYVSIGENVDIKNSMLTNSIINDNASIDKLLISDSLIGRDAHIEGDFKQLNIGDSSEVKLD